jgi:DNA-directed RNA polymerase sigma subunit (sigma70/sigma32)
MPKILDAYKEQRLSPSIINIAVNYAHRGSLSNAATTYKVTRERVRQCLIKARYRALDTKGRFL